MNTIWCEMYRKIQQTCRSLIQILLKHVGAWSKSCSRSSNNVELDPNLQQTCRRSCSRSRSNQLTCWERSSKCVWILLKIQQTCWSLIQILLKIQQTCGNLAQDPDQSCWKIQQSCSNLAQDPAKYATRSSSILLKIQQNIAQSCSRSRHKHVWNVSN